MEKLYTVKEVAEKSKQSEVSVRRHIWKGALPARKLPGGAVRVAEQDLLIYLGESIQASHV